MDAGRFDALTRSLTRNGTRRGVVRLLTALPLAGILAAFLEEESDAARRRRRRRHHNVNHRDRVKEDKGKGKKGKGKGKGKNHKKKNNGCQPQPPDQTCAGQCGPVTNNCGHTVDCGACGSCAPDSSSTTCAGRCGSVTNNCGTPVDCGSCACDPPCAICQTCVETPGSPGSCVQQAANTPCGEPGQVCQADGKCACTAASCPACTTCEPDGQCAPCPACTTCDGAGQCVACEAAGQVCCNQTCRDCCDDADCPEPTAPICVDHLCAPCSVDDPCPDGCCDDTGSCQAGTNDAACGAIGGMCLPCALGQRCQDRDCICDAASCQSGCCDDDQCVPTCPATAPICVAGTRTCVPCANDGACVAAGLGDNCCAGECVSDVCCGDAQCEPTGDTCTAAHECRCGSSAPCTGGLLCEDGACGVVCGSGFCAAESATPDCCGATCTNILTDKDNCGGCGNPPCPAGQGCVNGSCAICACPTAGTGCWTTVQQAVNAASNGDTISLCAGSHAVANLTTGKDLTLIGTGDGDGAGDTILTAGGSGFVFIFSGEVTLQDLRITGASAGCVYNEGDLTMAGCTVTGNTSFGLGAGIHNGAEKLLTMTGCTVTANNSDFSGGGIANEGGQVDLFGCIVAGNDAFEFGGGVYNAGAGTVTLQASSSVTDNEALGGAGSGGGIFNNGAAGAVTIEPGSTVTGNDPDDCAGNPVTGTCG